MRRSSKIALMIPLFVAGIFLFGMIVMLLWNNVMVPVLHVSAVSFWQALGLLVLSKIFFGGFGGGRGAGRYPHKEKMMWNNMTPEQKEKFNQEWKNRSRRWGYKPKSDVDENANPDGVTV